MEKAGQKSEIGGSNHVEEAIQSNTSSDGSMSEFDSLHHLLRASLKPELFQEVSRLLLGLNCGRALDLLTLPGTASTLSSNHDFDLQGYCFRAEKESLREPRIVRVGLIQNSISAPTTSPLTEQRKAIFEKLKPIIDAAGVSGVNILSLQEGWTMPFAFCTREKRWFEFAEPVDGESTKFLHELAQKYNMVIVSPILERDVNHGETIWNTVVIIGNNGNIIGKHRKNHILQVRDFNESTYYMEGNTGHPVFETAFGKIPINICYGSANAEQSQPIPTYNTQPGVVNVPTGDSVGSGSHGRARVAARGRGGGRAGAHGRVRGEVAEGVDEVRSSRSYWSVEDDSLLVSAWINISTNAFVSTDQDSNAFWGKIGAFYKKYRKPHQVERDDRKCKARWQKINWNVTKFVGCFHEASRMRASGEGDFDVMLRAHKLYAARTDGKRFKEEHAWVLLRDEPKWSVDYLDKLNRCNASGGSSKRSWSVGEGDTPSSDIPTGVVSVNPIERLVGIKKPKRKGKEVMSSDQAAEEGVAHELEKEESEKFNKMYELQMAKEIRKREKMQVYQQVKKMDLLSQLMSTPNLPPEGEKLKIKLFKEFAEESSP